MTDWCILRCSASKTLDLARSLAEAGFEVWAPQEMRQILVGKKREAAERPFPILPEYVFARMDRLPELFALSRSPSQLYQAWDREQRRMVTMGHPRFSVFNPNGRVQPQSDRSLAPLRTLEAHLDMLAARRREKANSKGPAPKFHAGQIVHVDGAGFEGLALTVAEDNRGKLVKLAHTDWSWIVEISAFKIRSVQVSDGSPEQGSDALAA